MKNRHDQILFWGCFIAIITTSYAFFSRMTLCGGQFITDFGLDKVSAGDLQGAGVWPFGVSIIIFSLFIDRIGYKVAMLFSFVSYLIYSAMAFAAYNCIQGLSGDALIAAQKHGYQLLYWGSIILGLGNGSVEAYANPIVATMFNQDKAKWLNRLHAGWPGGLIIGGLCTIYIQTKGITDWRLTLGIILIPALIFFFTLIGLKFPRSEREQAGVSYLAMLKELGAFGALVGFGLVFAQLFNVLIPASWHWPGWAFWIPTGCVTLLFAIVTRSFGRLLLAFVIIIMMPQAITELGTNSWITSLMQAPMTAAKYNPAWVLVYTSAIMLVLRFCAGPVIHKFSPPGLLFGCSTLAALGIFALSHTAHAGAGTIFAAATVFGVGITFFWPTILGLTTEQCPRGGALTLNAVGGIGMLAVGILGLPFLGYMQETSTTSELHAANPALCQQVVVHKKYLLGEYDAIDVTKEAAITDAASVSQIKSAETNGQFSALGKMALFPVFTLLCYLALILYFQSKGGYKPVQLTTNKKE